MKITSTLTFAILISVLFVFAACSKKDRPPTLVVTVQNTSGASLQGAEVHAWPTDLAPDPSNSGIPDSSMHQTEYTNEFGDATFDFAASAVLDLDVTYQLDTGGGTVELVGHKVVKIETIKQKEETNLFEETVIVE